ncbi:MAG: type II toxin-antitoxin system VapC family toxin [Microbacteriaceae bacterium]|nr:type II toxin-antitoxin system VapC family toxin [Microbacteriaceae bacterium]
MNLVIDCSAAINILRGSGSLRFPRAALYAPELIDVEYASAMRGLVHRRELSTSRADEFIATWSSARVLRCRHRPLLPRVWELRANFSANDASYVALAERLMSPLITADLRLAHAAAAYCDVIAVGDKGAESL